MRRLEVCVDSLAGAAAALRGGADRLELCGELTLGGLTPDPGLLEQVMGAVSVPVQVMIRPRGGGYVYAEDELEAMVVAIRVIRRCWPSVTGFVAGALSAEGGLAVEAMKRLREAAGDHPLTLHRAFDRTGNLAEALEACINLGIERVLTSGGAPCVDEGIMGLAALQRQAAGRILILPGGGVRPDNARHIIEATGVQELHLSGRYPVQLGPCPDDRAYRVDEGAIAAVRSIMNT